MLTYTGETFTPAANRQWWLDYMQTQPWPGEELVYALIQKFVRRFVVEDPAALEPLKGRTCFYLANHQTGIESMLFAVLAGGYMGAPLQTVAEIQHVDTYVGNLIRAFESYPGVDVPKSIIFFDEADQVTMLGHLDNFKASLRERTYSIMAHSEGARAYDCRHRVTVLSGALVDFAIENDYPIIPVWLAGGLPAATLPNRIIYPHEYGSQDFYLGRPIHPETLRGKPNKERVQHVIDAINNTGPSADIEQPNPPDQAFIARVSELRQQYSETNAALLAAMERWADPTPAYQRLIEAARTGADIPVQNAEDMWLKGLLDWLKEN